MFLRHLNKKEFSFSQFYLKNPGIPINFPVSNTIPRYTTTQQHTTYKALHTVIIITLHEYFIYEVKSKKLFHSYIF